MTDTLVSLRRKIDSAGDLQAVVRTMKALAASSIGQYERSVHALQQYARSVELGLSACFRQGEWAAGSAMTARRGSGHAHSIVAVVFGSDQGLVGEFNEVVADATVALLGALPGRPRVWAVGERVHARLSEAGLPLMGLFGVPRSVQGIAPLVGQILVQCQAVDDQSELTELHLFHNRSLSAAAYSTVSQRLLPLDEEWQRSMTEIAWPSHNLTEVIGGTTEALRDFIREYLFIALFRTCAESLASENASRLIAMERAERNIEELLEAQQRAFHHLRQTSIDEELFDVIAGFEALARSQFAPAGDR